MEGLLPLEVVEIVPGIAMPMPTLKTTMEDMSWNGYCFVTRRRPTIEDGLIFETDPSSW